MEEVAKQLVAPGKGIWAADASPDTLGKRLESVGIVPSEENRFKFREMTISTPGLGEFISGIILHDEAIRRADFLEILQKQGIVIGIKVDRGAKDMANFPGEKITEGLDGLRERLSEYKNLGAKFAKWRAVITIGNGIPTQTCIDSNSEALARYAALSQEISLVPIVEPEVLMDGDHDIKRSEEVTTRVLKSVFTSLTKHKIIMKNILLKPNLIHPGKQNSKKPSNRQIAQATLRTLKNTVPDEVPGIVFLSGGDKPEEITSHINIMNEMGGNLPWQISFSFERALEGPAMEEWHGDDKNVELAQKALYHRAKMNSLARSGKYSKEMEDG